MLNFLIVPCRFAQDALTVVFANVFYAAMSCSGSLQSHKANLRNVAVLSGSSVACMLAGTCPALSLRRCENHRFSAMQVREPAFDIFSRAEKKRHHRLQGRVE